METDFSKLSNYHKVERFIQNLGPVTKDQIHEFINDHNMPAHVHNLSKSNGK